MNDKLKTPTLMPMWTPYLRHIANGSSGSDFRRKTNMTASHLYKLLNLMEKDKILRIDKIGRTNYITLTAKGKRIKQHINGLYTLIGID